MNGQVVYPANTTGDLLTGSARTIVLVVASLAGLGLIMVFSAGSVYAGKFQTPWYFLWRQTIWLIIGTIVAFGAYRFDYRCLIKHWPKIAGLTIAVLATVLVLGTRWNGAKRWIRISGFVMQPSEMAKIATLVVLAAWLARDGTGQDFRRRFMPACLFLAAVCGLILLEPDLGTAVLIGLTATLMLLVGGMRLSHLAMLCLVALPPVAIFAWLRFDHVRDRLHGFFAGEGWQVGNAVTAIGNGGVWGVGLGRGALKNLFVPEVPTDFIFSAVGEELGLLGTAGIVLLFLIFLYHGMRITNLSNDRLGSLMAFGITVLVTLQAALNIGVVTGCLPPKGIALPFVSYGGSSLVFFMAGIGLLLNVAYHTPKEPTEAAFATVRTIPEETGTGS